MVLAALSLLALGAYGEKAPSPVAPLTEEALRNASYQSEWPTDGNAELTDGVYREKYMEGAASEIVVAMHPMFALGDLDGDGAEDAVVILVASGGGSGSFYSLEAVLNQAGNPHHVASAALGDRAQLESLSVASGRITVEMVTHGPNDPMCCPTLEVTQEYELQGGALVLLSSDA